MRQQSGSDHAVIVFNHGALGYAVVTGLMMLQAEMGHLVSHREQEVILVIVAGAIERTSLSHQALVFINHFRRHLQGSIAVRRHVNVMLNGAFGTERDATEMASHQYR